MEQQANGRRTVIWVAGLSALLGIVVFLASWFAVDTEREMQAARAALIEWAEAELPHDPEAWTDDDVFAGLAERASARGYVLHRAPTGESMVIELPEVGFFRVYAERRDGRESTALSPVSRPEWVGAGTTIISPEGN